MDEEHIDLTADDSDYDDLEPSCSSFARRDTRKRRRQTEAESSRLAKTTKQEENTGEVTLQPDSGRPLAEEEEPRGHLYQLLEENGDLLNKVIAANKDYSQEEIVNEGNKFVSHVRLLTRLTGEQPRAFTQDEIEAIGLLVCVQKQPSQPTHVFGVYDVVMKRLFGL